MKIWRSIEQPALPGLRIDQTKTDHPCGWPAGMFYRACLPRTAVMRDAEHGYLGRPQPALLPWTVMAISNRIEARALHARPITSVCSQ